VRAKKRGDFPFVICHFSFFIAGTTTNHRLESGLVRPVGGAQVPYLNDRRRNDGAKLHVYQLKMKNDKCEIENFGFEPILIHKVVCPR